MRGGHNAVITRIGRRLRAGGIKRPAIMDRMDKLDK